MSQHSPEPFSVDADGLTIRDANAFAIATCAPYQSNVRLFCAAPKMLIMLQMLRQDLSWGADPSNRERQIDALIKEATEPPHSQGCGSDAT